jgi:hypothetical protein
MSTSTALRPISGSTRNVGKEEIACMRQVLVKTGKDGAEISEMLKLLLVMNAFAVLARVNGSRGLREAECPLMTIHKPGECQRAWKGLFALSTSQKVMK